MEPLTDTSQVRETGASEPPLSLTTLIAYGAPSLAVGAAGFLLGIYLLKFSTDILLLAPAVMGTIVGLSRLWVAFTDPAAGYWSDRTRTRLGRRRSWILAAALPIALGVFMVWNPPRDLEGTALIVWMAVGMFGLSTALTMFTVPHLSLGAELSKQYHERTKIAGVRQLMALCGSVLGVACFKLMLLSEHGADSAFGQNLIDWFSIPDDPRQMATVLSLGMGALAMAAIVGMVAMTRERSEYQGRPASSPRAALTDVVRNPHARLLLIVFAIHSYGQAAQPILTPYHMQYVIGVPTFAAELILLYMVPSLLSIPFWIRLSRRFGKKHLWLGAMCIHSLSYFFLFFAQEGDVWIIVVSAIVNGIAGGCGSTVSTSIKADVIDWDEYHTGERKEGSYFAVWSFVQKAAFGLMAIVAMSLLQLQGFVPNAEQSEQTRFGLRFIFGVVPGFFYLIGALVFLRFRFNEAEHAEIRAELDARG